MTTPTKPPDDTQGRKTQQPDRMTGAELQTLREACNLSREELAGLAHVQARTVKFWEGGRAGVPADVADLVQGLDATINKATQQAARAMREAQALHRGALPAGLVLMRYRSAEDLTSYQPEMAGLPVNVHAAIVGRVRLLAQAHGVPVRVVWFEPEPYEEWRELQGMENSSAARGQWAGGQVAAQALPHRADQPPG